MLLTSVAEFEDVAGLTVMRICSAEEPHNTILYNISLQLVNVPLNIPSLTNHSLLLNHSYCLRHYTSLCLKKHTNFETVYSARL